MVVLLDDEIIYSGFYRRFRFFAKLNKVGKNLKTQVPTNSPQTFFSFFSEQKLKFKFVSYKVFVDPY